MVQKIPSTRTVVGAAAVRKAILIGVSDYEFSDSWPTLPGVTTDIDALQRLLKKHDFDVTTLASRKETTRTNILRTVQDLCYQAPIHSKVLVHFSGHGVTLDRHHWLVPADAPNLPSVDRASMAHVDHFDDYLLPADFRGAIADTLADCTLVTMDACRSRLTTNDRRAATPFLVVPSRDSQRVVLVYAARPGQESYELEDGKGGLVTHGLTSAVCDLGPDATLTQILKKANEVIMQRLRVAKLASLDVGIRIQCEFEPDLGILGTKFFSPDKLDASVEKATIAATGAPPGKSAASSSTPILDIAKFHGSRARERGQMAHAFLEACFEMARTRTSIRTPTKARYLPTEHDDRVYEDDDGFLDFNFWGEQSRIAKLTGSTAYFWYFISLQTTAFDQDRQPEPDAIEIHFGAVLTGRGYERAAKAITKSGDRAWLRDFALSLGSAMADKWRKVTKNYFGNLQIETAKLSLKQLYESGGATFISAFDETVLSVEAAILEQLHESARGSA